MTSELLRIRDAHSWSSGRRLLGVEAQHLTAELRAGEAVLQALGYLP